MAGSYIKTYKEAKKICSMVRNAESFLETDEAEKNMLGILARVPIGFERYLCRKFIASMVEGGWLGSECSIAFGMKGSKRYKQHIK